MARKKSTGAKKTARRPKRKKGRSRGKAFIISLISIAAVLYIAAGAYLYINQRNLIYFPTEGVEPTGEKTIEITSGDATLRGWEVNPGREHAIIYFGGNAERIENSIPDYRDLFPEHTIYFMNYRGYGESSGTPTEENLFRDAEAIYDAVSPGHENVTVIGRSLGSGVAVHLAAKRRVYQLILVTPFDCLAGVGQRMYPVFPVKLIMKDRYNSAEAAPEVTAPTLIVIAENDEVIPRESTQALIDAFTPDIVHVAVVDNATHNDIQNYTQFFMRIRDFQITGN